jgi:4-hydroxythreonine-4-phosphate dehydrogenase
LKPVIGITVGDMNGIGPEVALGAALHPSVRNICKPVLIGPTSIVEGTARRMKLRTKFEKTNFAVFHKTSLPMVDAGDALWADVTFGVPTKASGKNAGRAIEVAVKLCLEKKLDGFVTAPASKEALALAGYSFPGQTEMIALLSGSRQVAMMLVSEKLRVGLVTVHTPVQSIAGIISIEKIQEKVTIIHRALLSDFALKQPRIAVLGLNPHAGENGLIGGEEKSIVEPALALLREKQIDVSGPYPADGFFGSGSYKRFDAVVALYHDQGLIPLKMLAFDTAVNYSAGLPIVRTSPDHGTAYDIAGKKKANPKSTIEAVILAARIATNRAHRAITP